MGKETMRIEDIISKLYKLCKNNNIRIGVLNGDIVIFDALTDKFLANLSAIDPD